MTQELGFFFNKRTTTAVSFIQRMSVKGVLKEVELSYEILAILEFNSTRKRMSLVCKAPDGKLILFCKGADSVIYERLKATDNPYKDVTLEHLAEFASAGLRTLCLAYAEIDEKFFFEWQRKYLDAKTSMQDREAKVDAAAELIEKDLILLGATAIEDKLQEGVPDTIAQLAKAGIGLWMLTGDKVETAINIGFACSLLWNESSQYIIQTEVPEVEQIIASGASKAQINEKLVQVIHAQLKEALAEIGETEKTDPHAHNAVIIDGRALTFALMEECAQTFLALGKRCQSVICCRVSPRQKADVTMLVKEDGMITLGIGDGANDVGMIQAAHVGVGISGQEGMQAALASDYAIGQFRFLGRLLLVHGRYSYKRIARMITYFFYKNVVFGFSLLWFNGLAYFSGQLIYDDVFSSTYNVLFTSLPVLAIGIFDQDVSPAMAMAFPQLYKECSQNTYFTNKVKAVWFLNGMYQSVLLTFCVLAAYHGVLNTNGKIGGMVATGTALYTCIVITVNLQLALVVNYWNIFTHLSIFITLFGWFVFVLCYGALPIEYSLEIKDIMPEVLFPQPAFWLLIPGVLLMAVLPDLAIRVVRREWYPCDYQVIQEREKGHGKEQDLEQKSIPAPRRQSSIKAKPLYLGGVTPSAPEMLGYFAQLEAENADTPTRFSLGDQQEPVVGTVVGNVDLEMMKRLRSKAKAVKNAAMFLKTTANSMNMLVGSPLGGRPGSPSDPGKSPFSKAAEAATSKASPSPLRLATPANLTNRPNPAVQGHERFSDNGKRFSAVDFPTPKHAKASEISEVMDRL
ncbi:hypothetical protein CYMTET_10263 [Cymbomonas tetramitiformis]|uniref:Phospholipid-transporting ATPase n=1 Tax=Cymbomonas tetramitiformis TaxID=36881 RepID=A0AAE0GPI2_9CHLO|nr:hypothetical protein CYMTET_10263 [Cymbomonas tetramitiformis]